MSQLQRSLFSYNGNFPSYLPSRIRLADKTTRTPSSVTLDELHYAGYIGPIEEPSYCPLTQRLAWDSSSCTLSVEDLPEFDCVHTKQEDQTARSLIQELLNKTLDNVPPRPTQEYYAVLGTFVKDCHDLLNSSECIKCSSIPVFTPPHFKTEEDIASELDHYFSFQAERKRFVYENFGFFDNLHPTLRSYVTVPSGWTLNVNSDVALVPVNSWGNSEPEFDRVLLSGYSISTGSNQVSLDSTDTISLLFSSVYFPHG